MPHTFTDLNLIWIYQHVPVMVFLFGFGGCVGSFLNVVIYRLPEGRSVWTPPSRCPVCGANLKWYDNLPILGWFILRARCRYCKTKISPQYVIVELLMAMTFVGVYALLYLVHPDTPWWGQIGDPWWYRNEITRTWPAYVALVFLIAGLVAMTVIDARTFLIPIQIPLFVTCTAFGLWLVQSVIPSRAIVEELWPIPVPDLQWSLAAVGGMMGIVLSTALLKTGKLRYSFADYHEYVDEGETLGEYPHARREMFIELLFLAPCMAGLVLGHAIGGWLEADQPGPVLGAIGAASLGYLVGGGVVWGFRIVFSLLLGREAMGIGDVHLMAAVGAVLGWQDPLWAFFIAPFFGIIWFLLGRTGLLSWMTTTDRRELPYGPHLAAATIAVIFFRPAVDAARDFLFPMWVT